MTSRTAGSASPALAWFLRGQLLDRIVLVLGSAAVVTEFFILVLSGEPLVGYAGVVLGAAGLILCRFQRMAGLVVVVLGAVAAALMATEFVAMWSLVVFTLFSVTVRGTRPFAALLVAAIPVYLSLVIRDDGDFAAPGALIASACCAAGAAVGSAVRAQQAYLESMKQRAVDAEAAADLAVERGVAEERLRIARDLHDAVGHEVAVISMNLGAAEVQLPDGSAGARAALTAARVGVKGVLNEIQQILDVLRRGDAGADAAPVADVGQISGLVNTLQAAGTPVSASIDHIGLLNPGVSAAAFRIAQEALTNAQRHGTGPIRLSVSSDAHEVIIDVQNARPSHDPARRGSGYGLTGMKERAESVGGRLEVIADAKTFHIRAHLMRAANDHR